MATFTFIHVSVRFLSGDSFDLEVTPFETIENVKNKVFEAEGIPPPEQQLMFGEVELEDGSKLSDYGVVDGSELYVLVETGNQLQIKLKYTFSVNKGDIECDEVEDVRDVKILISESFPLPPSFHLILFKGEELSDLRRLSSYGMRNGNEYEIEVKHPDWDDEGMKEEYLAQLRVYVDEKGIDFASEERGRRIIHILCYVGFLAGIQFMVEDGEDINSPDKVMRLPIHYAAIGGHLNVVEWLVIEGVDPCAQDANGYSPLHDASRRNVVEVVEFFLNHGGDANSTTEDGWNPLHLASYYGNVDVAELLVNRGVDPNICNNHGFSPLHLASQEGHLDVVELLVGHEAEINPLDKFGMTPLHWGCKKGNLDVVEYLFDHGGDLNIKSERGRNSLRYAIVGGHLEVVKFLVDHGGDLNSIENNGENLLQLACVEGHLEVVRLLIDHGMDPHEDNEETLLHLSATLGHKDLVEYLCNQHRVNPFVKNAQRRTARDVAVRNNHPSIATFLERYEVEYGEMEEKDGDS